MKLRFIDWIWHVRGTVALGPHASGEDAFGRLAPLFDQPGTTHERSGDSLAFRKKDQAAQDKMSVFDSGVLTVEQRESGAVLRYDLISRALLYCFLAPLFFLAYAQGLVAYDAHHKAPAHAAGKAEKKAEKPPVVLPQNPIDKALGAPAPDKPKKDDEKKDGGNKHSPTSSYVFAGIFAVLYVVGRLLEAGLIKALFTRTLSPKRAADAANDVGFTGHQFAMK